MQAKSRLEELDEEIADLLGGVIGDERLYDWIVRNAPRHKPPKHVQPLLDLLERARLEPVRACVSMPPRHAKTTTIVHAIPWWLQLSPADTNAYVTYGDDLSRSKSRIARRLATDSNVKLADDSKSLSEWRTTAGGGLLATGIGGPLTGQGITGLLVVDDPIKNRAEAESELARGGVWDWFNDVAYTRLEPGASCIVVQTRWHDDDLTGRLLSMGVEDDPDGIKWECINLAAIAENDNDPLGRAPGEALWPDRYPLWLLKQIRSQIGEWGFGSLYQGRPKPKGSKVFGEPGVYDPATVNLTGCRVYIGVDPAATASTKADYSVAIAIAVRFGPDRDPTTATCYVLDVLREQMEVPDFIKKLRAFQIRWYSAPAAIEAVGLGKAVPQMHKVLSPDLNVFEIPAHGDKFTRAQPVAAAWNEGRVLVPMNAPWLSEFKKELLAFTGVGDKQDDQVDGLSHAWNSIAWAPVPVVRGAFKQPRRWR